MASTNTESDDDVIDVEELRRFADCISAIGGVYGSMAEWLKKHGVSRVPGAGMPTARRGARYLANFTSTVLTAYHEAKMAGLLEEAPPQLIAKALGAEAAAKNLANGKRKPKK
jgi:hypothetical protein